MNRRQFLNASISFASLLIFHKSAQKGYAISESSKTTIKQATTRFPQISLFTSKLDLMLSYYTKKLQLPLLMSNKDAFVVRIGQSILKFSQAQDGAAPTYHYAINIPTNKFKAGKKWLEQRTSLLIDSNSGNDELYFDSWNAHAVYFEDPVGNLVS